MANNRRKDILKSAQEVFSKKGLEDSSISEIAKKAGVVDSIIYHYFKNKEDLLFHSLADKMQDVSKELHLHLEGIMDPASKLGKMIWFHLYINDLSPDDTRLLKDLLFECRSNQNFYDHTGYRALKDYTRIMTQILRQGVDLKIFRPDVDYNLVTNVIFGLLDEESLNRFASREITTTLPDFNKIMHLVFAMISEEEGGNDEQSEEEDKEIRILRAAEHVFSAKGYNAATMAQIAQAAGVAEGTIYTYFENKSDVLFSIPKKRFRWLKDSISETFEIRHPIRKLRRFIRLLFTTFMWDRNFLKVFLLNIKLNKKFYVSAAYRDYLDYVSQLETILMEGQEQGIFNKDVDQRIFRNLFLGAFTHLATRWIILEKAVPIDVMRVIEDVVQLICMAIVEDKSYLVSKWSREKSLSIGIV